MFYSLDRSGHRIRPPSQVKNPRVGQPPHHHARLLVRTAHLISPLSFFFLSSSPPPYYFSHSEVTFLLSSPLPGAVLMPASPPETAHNRWLEGPHQRPRHRRFLQNKQGSPSRPSVALRLDRARRPRRFRAPRHHLTPVHRRPHLLGGHWCPHDRVPAPPRARERRVFPHWLQEWHRWKCTRNRLRRLTFTFILTMT